jgi:decaprenylphospho-beta-D-ribofuranose 2-oxidase
MKLNGWGRYPIIDATAGTFETVAQAARLVAQPGEWIAHGLGKSYGDSALNPQVLMTRRMNKLLDFDAQNGTVTCESGVTLAELIDIFLPHGWFLKVTPGTKLITVGGAIASDVHGKNHHTAGCFSASVVSLALMLSDGDTVHCSAEENPSLFRATCGGMGLTGLILAATLQLQRVQSAYIRERIIRCPNLADIFHQFENHQQTSYSVAWIDCLAKGKHLGRSVLMLGEHDTEGPLVPVPVRPVTVPMVCPGFLLNKYSVALFNQLYFSTHPCRTAERRTTLDAFFYPLDRVAQWNRMYGSRGFTQYQFVLPKAASFEGLHAILEKIAASGIGSFLAVLKLFGPQNHNYLSFPMEGYTLALDFKIQPRLFPLLDQLDRMVLDHGGRLYLTKDVRMSADTFTKGYPQWEKFKTVRTEYGALEKFNSLQSKRMGL